MSQKNKKILIVEDTEELAQLIQMILNPRGYETTWVSNGSKALAAAKEIDPSLILLDVMLPGSDGYSVQNSLLEDEQTRTIPVVVMTSKPRMEELFKDASNVAGFIQKPFNVKDFIAMVEAVFKNKESSGPFIQPV